MAAQLPDDLAANTVEVEAPGFDLGQRAAELLHLVLVRRVRQGRARGRRGRGAAGRERAVRAGGLVARCPSVCARPRPRSRSTGGLHATGLFSAEAELLCVREDVGRHNAMDKVIGWAFLEGRLPLVDAILCVSGRLSFELVQKAAVAGCPLLVAVGAPSSLAVELAADRGITLCGFVRGGSLNVYTEPWRVVAVRACVAATQALLGPPRSLLWSRSGCEAGDLVLLQHKVS